MPIIETNDLKVYYGNFQVLRGINLSIEEKRVTSLIGPSGCGKSTLLRTFNRMNDLIEGVKNTGVVLIESEDIYHPRTDLLTLRRKVGMVFQRPNPFPISIVKNISFGIHIHRIEDTKIAHIVEKSLKEVLLWEELKDKLHTSAIKLSLEQQQRLCIARALAVKPKILLMDEPCSALDPIATQRVEELIQELKKEYTIVIVTHNMQQAARVSQDTGFMLLGELIEFGPTERIFTTPHHKQTENYITGRFG